MKFNPIITFASLIQKMPQFSLNALSHVGAKTLGLCLKSRNRLIYSNLCTALGEEEASKCREQIQYHVWRNIFESFFEIICFPSQKEAFLDSVKTDNFATFEKSLEKGKGAILLAPHIGNVFVGAAKLASCFPTHVMVRPSRNPMFQELMQSRFESMNFTPIDRVGGLRKAYRALQRNEIVVFALDQHAGDSGVWVDFFGKPASTSGAPAMLAQKLGTPVHLGYLTRESTYLSISHNTDPIPLVRTGNDEHDLLINTARFSLIIEDVIRKYPDTWLWMHKRWKAMPPEKQEQLDLVRSLLKKHNEAFHG